MAAGRGGKGEAGDLAATAAHNKHHHKNYQHKSATSSTANNDPMRATQQGRLAAYLRKYEQTAVHNEKHEAIPAVSAPTSASVVELVDGKDESRVDAGLVVVVEVLSVVVLGGSALVVEIRDETVDVDVLAVVVMTVTG